MSDRLMSMIDRLLAAPPLWTWILLASGVALVVLGLAAAWVLRYGVPRIGWSRPGRHIGTHRPVRATAAVAGEKITVAELSAESFIAEMRRTKGSLTADPAEEAEERATKRLMSFVEPLDGIPLEPAPMFAMRPPLAAPPATLETFSGFWNRGELAARVEAIRAEMAAADPHGMAADLRYEWNDVAGQFEKAAA